MAKGATFARSLSGLYHARMSDMWMCQFVDQMHTIMTGDGKRKDETHPVLNVELQ